MKVTLKKNQKLDGVWFDSGEVVVVLGLELKPGLIDYVLWSNRQQSCGLFSAEMFDILDDKVSVRWVCSFNFEYCFASMGPAAWGGEFWNKYNEGDLAADAVFHAERKLLEMD